MIDRELVMDLRTEIRKMAREEVKKAIEEQIEPKREEPSYEAVKEYCRKRCLSIVDTALLGKYTPSAQPEIIHCRDCKYAENWYEDRRRCFLWSEDGVSVFDDGYCNYAERKTDG